MVRLMKALTISDQQNMILALQDEIRRNDTSRYDHRLHGVLLVAQGMTLSTGRRCAGRFAPHGGKLGAAL
jgi:hypothetical protein